jgi:hypothetical protein
MHRTQETKSPPSANQRRNARFVRRVCRARGGGSIGGDVT